MTKVINIKTSAEKDYVYCGRPSLFGNPYSHIRSSLYAEGFVSTREESISKFKIYFYKRLETDSEFKQNILKLKDKTLGCFCVPNNDCHCLVIAAYLDGNSTNNS